VTGRLSAQSEAWRDGRCSATMVAMAAYVVVDVRRTDLERAARYSALSGPSVERHGGRFLARGGAVRVLEGDWNPERVVVIEFSSADAAQAWFDSPDYVEARAVREGAGTWFMIVVDGIGMPSVIDSPNK
jgi:uncharacterized protein (DUF1330 family)